MSFRRLVSARSIRAATYFFNFFGGGFVFGMVQLEPWYEKLLSIVIFPLKSENTAFLIQKTFKYKIKNGQEIVKNTQGIFQPPTFKFLNLITIPTLQPKLSLSPRLELVRC